MIFSWPKSESKATGANSSCPFIENFENTSKRGGCKSLGSYILWEIFTLTCCIADQLMVSGFKKFRKKFVKFYFDEKN